MKTILYITVNTINNKIYIGVHSTKNPDIFDGYLGCGCYFNQPSTYKNSKTPFQYAINKYGVNAFRRYTLAVFDTAEEAFSLESKIVNEEFIKKPYVYNAIVGGKKGPDQSITIYQYDLEGAFIDSYSSYKKAAECFGCSTTSIENAVKFKSTSQKSLWTTYYTSKLNIQDFNIFNPGSIYEFNENLDFIKSYDSVTDIIKKYSLSRTTINRAIQGKYSVNGKYYSREFFEKFPLTQTKSIKNCKIYLYNLDGTFYKEFSSPIACAREFGLKSSSSISSAIRLGRTFKGFQVYLEKVDCAKQLKLNNQKQIVQQFDLKGNFIKEFSSITEAIQQYGQGVRRCIKGQSKHCKNFIFKLKES